MTIGLFFNISDRGFGRSLLKELISTGLPVRAFEVGSGWDAFDGNEYAAAFSELGQIVVIVNKATLAEQWFSMLTGVVLGSERELHLYEGKLSKSPQYPLYLAHAHRSRTVSELTETLRFIHTYQVQQQRISEARDRLLTLGYSLDENAFAGAVAEGNLEAVDLFLTIGMSPDTVNSESLPVLSAAVRNQQEEVARMLVQRGADVNVKSGDRSNSPLMEAAGRGMSSLVKLFLHGNAEVNLQSDNGQTALMLAVAEGFDDTAVLLIRNRADPHVADKLGMSARKYAELYARTKVLEEIDKLYQES